MNIERKWIGIIIGSCIIAGTFYSGLLLQGDTFLFHIISSLIGGGIAGLFTAGKIFDGIKSGFMSGFIGSLVICIIILFNITLTLIRGPMDFIGGFVVLFGLIFTALAILFASIGGVIGVKIRDTWK
ncbi:MAG: hypothetical protein A4E42_01465 [Methanoregulaceae archaeon PtaU1.Bin222]|nr:MAG: hypothetical protein A4E42_01465 [Methanoregulaceae archaeon PtaU1.Bin222]